LNGLQGHDAAILQPPVSSQVQLRDAQLRFTAVLLGLRLRERRLDGAIVDTREQLAALDELALVEQHLGDNASDLRAQYDTVQRLHSADTRNPVRYVASLGLDHRDRDGGATSATLHCLPAVPGTSPGEYQNNGADDQ